MAQGQDVTNASTPLEIEVGRLRAWRDELVALLAQYREWLEDSGGATLEQTLRIFDLAETLDQRRMTIAFVAEVSRGKSELINALFFARHGRRVLPSGIGRTTMCPTEIFSDREREPSLFLLPIETRRRAETLDRLKAEPLEWAQIQLNLDDVEQVKSALKELSATKSVRASEAAELGFPAAESAAGGEATIDIPMWRYAMLNYPHPLLDAGIGILDTPGMNALGVEPELTLSVLPNVHAVVFVVSVDSGVTRSDLEMWKRFVSPALAERIVVVNKIDVLWDRIRTDSEIASDLGGLMDSTARVLQIPRGRVLPMSAQKALSARITGDTVLEAQSNIDAIERYLAYHVAPLQKELMAKAALGRIGSILSQSRMVCLEKLKSNEALVRDISELAQRSRDESQSQWTEFSRRKSEYTERIDLFKQRRARLRGMRDEIGNLLGAARLDAVCEDARKVIAGSWTTIGLTSGMRELIRLIRAEFAVAMQTCDSVNRFLTQTYSMFEDSKGSASPRMDLGQLGERLTFLEAATEEFCSNPVNVVFYEKGPMLQRFWNTLVDQARRVYGDARRRVEHWLATALAPIEAAMRQSKEDMEGRLQTMTKLHEKTETINGEMKRLGEERSKLLGDFKIIARLQSELDRAGRQVISATPGVPEGVAA